MDNIPKLEINIKDFRAINSADIILNGITVMAGNNGSGKSTISKLLYHTLKSAIDFDKIVAKSLFSELLSIQHFLEEFSHEIDFYVRQNIRNRKNIDKDEYNMRFKFNRLFEINGDSDLKEKENRILSAIDLLIKTLSELPNELAKDEIFNRRLYRLERFFKEEFFDKENNTKSIEIAKLLEKLKEEIKNKFKLAYKNIENRPISILDKIISSYFTEEVHVKNYNVNEYGTLITNRKDKKLSNFLTINKVVYIDTPMIVGVDNIRLNNIPHWEDLDDLLKNKEENNVKRSTISNLLKDEIIDGETNYDSNNNIFMYKRNDGYSIDLLSCATGLKSFSIMQILYNSGFLDDKTLLIIDEPETHLHPEWIVQYARLIVLLHKELKVNFLIGSHNPDMVMAIKYITKKELGEENNPLNFYFASATENDKYKFDFKPFETNIEQIFKSFNTSLDDINKYGATEE
ncbi:MAG: AAA family ATPase [Candidatus Kapaibacterium sp.]